MAKDSPETPVKSGKQDRLKILLVGQHANSFSDTAQQLTAWGADCKLATSYVEACSLLSKNVFDVVMAEMNLGDGSARRLAPLLRGSRAALFCAYPIEDSCLWIPIVAQGVLLQRRVALSSGEFSRMLHDYLSDWSQIQSTFELRRRSTGQKEAKNHGEEGMA